MSKILSCEVQPCSSAGTSKKIFGGLPRHQLAAIDITDDRIIDFSPKVVTRYGVWKALAGPEGLWLGGEFTEVEGRERGGFAFLANDDLAEPIGTVVLSRGERWRYDDSDQAPAAGTAWTEPGFDDSSWLSANAEFGFGDDEDQQTVIARTDTLYARTTVTIADPQAFERFSVRLLADAGGAVYLNGTEVARDNLPDGPLQHDTRALVGKWTTGERLYSEHTIDPSMFVAGTNTIAVQVHGAYVQSNDLSFDLELVGIKRPVDRASTIVAIDSGSPWRYLDDRSQPEDEWVQPDFVDLGWPTGNSQFGFGDGDEATDLRSGATTYWFRHSFDVEANAPRATGAVIELLADDGAVIYLNGTEVVRQNMPDGPARQWTGAATSVWGDSESTYTDHQIDPTLLRPGRNTVAVSVHNLWSGNGDLSFDLRFLIDRIIVDEPPIDRPQGPVALVAADADWSYLDDGSNPGASWAAPDFTVGPWAIGTGEFGFGDGRETTTFEAGNLAYFLRTEFTVDALPDQLELDVRYDDGIAVYLNGDEVARRNLPNGPVSNKTAAIEARWGDTETTPETIKLDPALLVEGTNTLAISLHNQWDGNVDLSLMATLTGRYDPTPDGGEPDGGQDPAEPMATLPVVGTDTWAYRDEGNDLGAGWRSPGYADDDWPTAGGWFGFGDNQATELRAGSLVYYFRKAVNVERPAQSLTLRLVSDDGAVVYLNGIEVVRRNMPAGELDFETRPLGPIWGDDESSFEEYQLDPTLLTVGENTIAVEVRNFSPDNGDLSFALELIDG